VSRRVSLPGAAELFRVTDEPNDEPSAASAAAQSQARDEVSASSAPAPALVDGDDAAARGAGRGDRRHRARAGERRPTGRERHEEKITVYCSADELIDLEHARLTLRGEFGLAVDRGRIVREAVAVVIADLEAKGASSILVRRLRGRS
jgi:hypothetical protein